MIGTRHQDTKKKEFGSKDYGKVIIAFCFPWRLGALVVK
jgi:hypothetical protein